MDETYNGRPRRLETYTVKSIGDGGLTTTNSTGFGIEPEYEAQLQPGTVFDLETVNFSLITGIRIGGEWLYRKSDQVLDNEHEEMVARFASRRAEQLAEHRAEWTAKKAALPDWIRVRVASFHETGGETFELEGWGYELAVAELAVLYVEMGNDAIAGKNSLEVTDSEAVAAYARENGTSGNQHDVALAIAKAHLTDPAQSMGGTVAALAPLTGSVDYAKARA